MINIDDLWIGDVLRLKRSGRVGRYHGSSPNGKLRVKIGEKIVSTTPANLEVATETDLPTSIKIKVPASNLKSSHNQQKDSDKIDLHIEVLNPSMMNGQPERIIAYQINAARNFINQAIVDNKQIVEIIHGKGLGVLRAEVLHLLSLYDEVRFSLPKNDGGSTEIWLQS